MKSVLFPAFMMSLLFTSCSSEATIGYDSFETGSATNESVAGTSPLLERMDYYNVPGLSIAVVANGKLSWARGYGVTNSSTGQKVEVNTLFQAGSVSKPVAALAALQLVDEEKIDLDTDVNNYLGNWKVAENKFTKNEKVTLRRLLTHSAGFTLHGFPGYKHHQDIPTLLSILQGKGNTPKLIPKMVPGSKWKYSGAGYVVMQKLVEDISGLSFEQYVDQFLFAPLNMSHSTFQQPLPAKMSRIASAGHFDGEVMDGLWNNYPELAAAGLWATPSDLAKICMEIHQILSKESEGILSKNTTELMLTKHLHNWGLGPSLSGSGDSLIFQHNGSNDGFYTSMKCFAYPGNAVVVMANGHKCRALIAEIQRSIVAFYGWENGN